MSPGRRLVALYMLIQSALGAAWWGILAAWPASRSRFQPDGFPPEFILTYALPDGVLFVGASLVTGVLFLRGSPRAILALWLTTGAVAYATLHTVGIALMTKSFAGPAVMMIAPCTCTLVMALTCARDEPLLPRIPFGRASGSTAGRALGATLAQMVVFWTVFLLVIPGGIVWVERAIGVPTIGAPTARIVIGASLFLAASALGVWSAVTLSTLGLGTPLPTNAPERLVTRGPYAYVRNPMAVAGLAQGLAVAIACGSLLTLVYVAIGGLLWDACVRPAEEEELASTFGAGYARYRAGVKCWRPRALRYRDGNASR